MLELKEVRYTKTIDNSLNDGELFNFLKHPVEQHEIECVKTIATLYDDNTKNVLCVKEYEGYYEGLEKTKEEKEHKIQEINQILDIM